MTMRGQLIFSLCSLLCLIGLPSLATSAHRPHSQQRERDRVVALPGQPANVTFSQYAGYVTVEQKARRVLFYWLIEAAKNPESKPLILWLNGGPGCSSIAYGASEEVGPFRVNSDGETLSLSTHAWNIEANLLFLDSPAGVGFSYSSGSADQTPGDKRTGEDAYKFLSKWLKRFPEFQHRPFYIAGESYAGHYIPELSKIIVDHNKHVKNPFINFKGFLLGNPLLDDVYDNLGTFEFWWNHGLISDSTYSSLNNSCLYDSFLFPGSDCNDALTNAYTEFGAINPYSIYDNACNDEAGALKYNLRYPFPWTFRGNDLCVVKYTKLYMNRRDVQKALHANTTGIPHPWVTCSESVRGGWSDSPKSMLPIIQELIAAGIRIWVFSGDTDAVLPLTATRYSIKSLNLPVNISLYAWYDNLKVGGWSQVYEGLTYLTVRGAGHEVPLTQPRLALSMLRHFLSNQMMPMSPM